MWIGDVGRRRDVFDNGGNKNLLKSQIFRCGVGLEH
jgi:hypothetical protein